MAKIQTIKDKNNTTIYPQTHTKAVYTAQGEKLQDLLEKYLVAEDAGVVDDVQVITEVQNNKVLTIDENSTDATYPSAKAVYDAIIEFGGISAAEGVITEEDINEICV